MCGIAGYNASEAFTKKRITPERQRKLLEVAWTYNLHRGQDAAGYFAVYPEDSAIKVLKKDCSGEKLLTNMGELRPARVFGAHTRQATQGAPNINANNHPVYYDGIWVTHNGTIRNDKQVREYWPKEVQDGLPEVDTVAINLALSTIKDIDDIQDVGDTIYDMLGGTYAFHAVWKDEPGMSYIVRGSSSPLIIAWNENEKIFFYASVMSAVWAMMDVFGFNPKDKEWRVRELEPFTAIQVHNGKPHQWLMYRPAWGTSNKADYWVSRLLPYTTKDGKEDFDVVYTTDKEHHFIAKDDGKHRRSLMEVDNDDIDLVYTREQGFTDNERFPLKSDAKFISRIAEADWVGKVRESKYYHAFFGDVEIIMDGSHRIQDTYHHSLGIERRFHVEKKNTSTKDESKGTMFEAFLVKETNTCILPSKMPEPLIYVRRRKDKKDEKKGKRDNIVPLLSVQKNLQRDNKSSSKTGDKKDTSDKGTYIYPQHSLSWDNLFHLTFVHENEAEHPGMFFIQNFECPKHNQWLISHDDPEQCGIVKACAAHAWSAVTDIVMIPSRVTNTYITYTSPEAIVCGDQGAKHPQHYWFNKIVGRVTMTASQNYFEIPLVDECARCKARAELSDIPAWLEAIVDRKEVMTLVG